MKSFIVSIILLIVFPALLFAEVHIRGRVTSSVDNAPLKDVRIDAELRADLKVNSATTSADGNFDFGWSLPDPSLTSSVYITLRFIKDGYDLYNQIEGCNFQESSICIFHDIELVPISGSAALDETEESKLESLKSLEGRTLFLLPYRISPSNTSFKLDMDMFSDSLFEFITTRLQDLESYPDLAYVEPFEPLSIVPVPQDNVKEMVMTNLEKIKVMGNYLNALAIVSGSVIYGTGDSQEKTVTIRSNFVIIPPKTRLLIMSDRDIPVDLFNTYELEQKLSLLWSHNALIAMCKKEFNRAKEANDRKALDRVRKYLIAERSRASGEEQLKVDNLNRLLLQVEQELRP